MMLLAIDTATGRAGCALREGNDLLAELSWEAGRNHSRDLAEAVRNLCVLARTPLRAVGAVVVASGPGSFSGLRVGIAYTKGIAFARSIPLAGIPTLDILAFQVSPLSDAVTAVLPAGRGDVYVAGYRGRGDSWHRDSEYQLLTVQEAARRAAGSLLVGEASSAVAAADPGAGMSMAPPLWQLRRPGFLAELGSRYLAAGGADQSQTLEPLYLRRSAAEETRAAGG